MSGWAILWIYKDGTIHRAPDQDDAWHSIQASSWNTSMELPSLVVHEWGGPDVLGDKTVMYVVSVKT